MLTGVGESLTREEMTDLIKKYGGKVTTSVSRRTSYLVVGEDAGESKLSKVCGSGLVALTRLSQHCHMVVTTWSV